jgi:Tfp pilus assembly protein FimT
MVVTAIFILVSAIAFPYIAKPSPRLVASHAAAKIERVLTTARLQASLRGVPATVLFDPESRAFSIVSQTESQLEKSGPSSFVNITPARKNDICVLPENMEIVFQSSGADQKKITFFPDGTASGPAFRLSFKGTAVSISISHLTGMVKVAEENE